MTESGSRLERFLERAAGLGSVAALHPAALLQQIYEAATGSVRDGSVANAYALTLAPADAKALAPFRPQLTAAVEEMLDDLVRSRRLARPGPWDVQWQTAAAVGVGQVQVRAEFRNPSPRGRVAAPGPTEVIVRHRGKFLVVEGLGRVRLTHTPFTIGRAADCDLVLTDLSVSRRHVRIQSEPDGSLTVQDLGSRNGIVVDGEKRDCVPMVPGVGFKLGTTELVLEVEA